MTKSRWLLGMGAACLVVLAMLASPGIPVQAATPVFYTGRPAFEAVLGTMVTDGYGTPPYPAGLGVYDDATFSAFLGETDYHTTGFANNNLHGVQDYYCGGCNGSFELSFQTTSVSQGGTGVYGVGLEIVKNDSPVPLPYYAFITYGDGTTDNILLPVVAFPGTVFWGVTAPELIVSIHFGLSDGGFTTGGEFSIDNLTIGTGPELGDLAWCDTDQNGIQDAGEPGLQGIAVDLFHNGTCAGRVMASDTTDASGNYLFIGLQPGTYCLQFYSIPVGWSITLQDQGADDTLDSDADPATGRIENINWTTDDLGEDIGLYPPVVEEEFVPEPGTILLLGSGLAGLGGYAALRHRSGQALRRRARD